MARQGRKKRRTHAQPAPDNNPKSFVVKSALVKGSGSKLALDFRKTMLPYTAAKLKERKANKVKDFVHVAGQLGVTHLICFTASTNGGVNMRIGRIPRGPTLYFHVEEYSLAKDVLKMQKRPMLRPTDFAVSPVVVLNNFGDEKHVRIITSMLQNMYPTIKVAEMKLSEAKRVILYNWNAETNLIEFRHFSITVKSMGLSKSVKTIIQANIPDLKKYEDISDFIIRGAFASESDVEDMDSKVQLPETAKSTRPATEQRAVKLLELGPRLSLRLTKIQDGLCGGEIVHHEYVVKTEEQIKELRLKKKQQRELKEKRKAEQERNVQAKKDKKKKKRKDDGEDEEAEQANDEDLDGDDDEEDVDVEEDMETEDDADDADDADDVEDMEDIDDEMQELGDESSSSEDED